MATLFRIVKSAVFLGLLCISLAASTAFFAVKSAELGVKVASLAAEVVALKIAAQRDKTKAVAEAKAKTKARERARARVRRFAIAGAAVVPVAGIFAAPAIAGFFEVADFNDWKTDNPEEGFGNYACETGGANAGLVDEVLQELPESIRPRPDIVRAWMPECDVPLEAQPWNSVMPGAKDWLPSLDGHREWALSPDGLREWALSPDGLKGWVPDMPDWKKMFQGWIQAPGSESPEGPKNAR